MKTITPQIRPTKKQELAWDKWMDDTTRFIVFGGGAGGGKAQPLTSKVFTPTGYKSMGDIQVGDTVLSTNGATTVTHIHPQGKKKIYKLLFSDGASTRATEDHLWDTWISSRKGRRKVRSTKELLQLKSKAIIPLASALFDAQPVVIDPYVLGFLLGDGGLTKQVTFTTADEELVHTITKLLPSYFIRKTAKYQYSITQMVRTSKGYGKNELIDKLRLLGLHPSNSGDKFIPEQYKYNSIEVRTDILKGLMDTDGYVDTRGHFSYTSKSKRLAEDVQFIVRSLGGRATLKQVQKKCGNNGKIGTYYTVYFTIKDSEKYVTLARKRERVLAFNGGASEVGRRIVSIVEDGYEEAQCITIADSSHLYLTDDFIVTHNSWSGCEMILTSCYFYPGSSWFLARNELKRLMNTTYKTFKKVCTHHGIPDTDWRLDGQYNIIYFNNGSEVHLLDVAHKPTDDMYERFGSYEFTGGFGDEINEWEFDAYDVLKSRIGRNNVFSKKENKMVSPPADYQDNPQKYPELTTIYPKFFGACNPAKNWVYQEFYKPWKNGTLPQDKAFIQSLYSDNPYTAHTYGEQLASIKNVINRQRLMEGKWEYTDDISSLTTYASLEEMFSNPEARTGIRYAVFDIARGGADSAVANIFDGWHSYKRIKMEKTDDPMELRQEIRDILAQEQIAYKNAIYDDNGVGWAIAGGDLKGMRQFVGSRSPLPTKEQLKIRVRNKHDPSGANPNFTNLKSQAGFYLADKINNHEASSVVGDDSEIIIEDLTALLVQEDVEREGKLKLRPKEDVKDDLGRSPDYGDTYVMRAWFDLYENTQKSDPEDEQRVSEYYKKLALQAKMKKEGAPRAGLR